MMVSIQPDWKVVIGIAITMALGLVVGPVIRCVVQAIPTPPPNQRPTTVALWERLIRQSTGGAWIGFFERLLFFAAFWISDAWPIFTSWLVFKLAFYWQGANFTKFPESAPGDEELEWFVARRQLGTHHVATALVGTAANAVAAFAGVAIAGWIKFG